MKTLYLTDRELNLLNMNGQVSVNVAEGENVIVDSAGFIVGSNAKWFRRGDLVKIISLYAHHHETGVL